MGLLPLMTNLWNVFTAAHEYDYPVRDKFGRTSSLAASHLDVQQPMVSQHLFQQGLKPHYPDGKKVAVCLSHDIDVLKRSRFEIAKSVVARMAGSGSRSYSSLWYEISQKRNPEWTLNRLYEDELKHGARSTYFFLALQPNEPDYNYSMQFVTHELKHLVDNGFEVSLHGNFNSASDAVNASTELKRLGDALNTTVTGYRNHYLCFDIQKSWSIWQNLGIVHDSTFGFANMPGFRNGMCYPFKPFSITDNKFLDIVELPLIVMDATLFNYLKLDVDGAYALVQQLFERVKAVNGVFTLLWHNNYTTGAYGELYTRLLDYFQSQNAWMPTHGKLVEWWKQNGWLEQSTQMLSNLKSQPHEAKANNR